MNFTHLARLFVAGAALGLAACGGGSDGSSGSGALKIFSCGLGCSGPELGPISCTTTEVFINQEFWVEFSGPIDISTVNSNTFRIVDSITGQVPIGQFLLDPTNARRVVFRPTLTFDNNGNPLFGLTTNSAYTLRIPGSNSTDQGPFIENVGGSPNTTELNCFVEATLGVNDPVPGPPTVTATLELIGPSGLVVDSFPLDAATDVPSDARVRLVFDDIMNPATLVNPATNQANFLTVRLDLDSDSGTLTDQLPVAGDYGIAIDPVLGNTVVTFEPAGGFPTAGPDPDNPRLIVIDLPPTIVDLGGNGLTNAGLRAFSTSTAPSVDIELAEDFTDTEQIDIGRTGFRVDLDGETTQEIGGETLMFTGRLLKGLGGGSGRLGSIVLEAGDELVLSTGPIPTVFGPGLTPGPVDEDGEPTTDEEDIVQYNVPSILLDNYSQGSGEPGASIRTVGNGVFELDNLTVGPGAKLSFIGENPPRMFVRGVAEIVGAIDLTPIANGDHPSSEPLGQAGRLGQLGGGDGGDGGDRPDTGPALQGAGTLADPFFGINQPASEEVLLLGAPGGGRGNVGTGISNGGGAGGVRWPTIYPGPTISDLGNAEFIPLAFCGSRQQGAPGAGGSYGTAGTPVEYRPYANGTQPMPPPLPLAGNVLSASVANLDPATGGTTIGGAGGGGGGNGIITTALGSISVVACMDELEIYIDHSGAGGGAGGAGVQVQAGQALRLSGTLSVAGGDGGGGATSNIINTSPQLFPDAWAAPGGGGSGGAVLLQSLDLDIAAIPGAIDIRGGKGGTPHPLLAGIPVQSQTRGGDGGAGIVQLFGSPLEPLDFETELAKVRAFDSEDDEPMGFDPTDILSVSDWGFVTVGLGTTSGFQSCWREVPGSFFNVDFAIDDFSDPDPANWVYGWNMKVELSAPYGVVDYRGDSGLVTTQFSQSLEELSGNQIGSSAIVVRFQGARTLQPLADPCNVQAGDEAVLTGSLTPWLETPEELNTYWETALPGDPTLAAQRKPNVVRYVVLINTAASLGNFVDGIVELNITGTAD